MAKFFACAIAAVLSALLLLSCPLANAAGSVAVSTNQTVYKCYLGSDSYGVGYYSTKVNACAAFFSLATATGRLMASTKTANSAGTCYTAISWSVSGTVFTQTTTITQDASAPTANWCGAGVTSQNYDAGFITGTANVCPANATGSPAANPTACTCNTGYKPDTSGTACIPDCTKFVTAAEGYFDLGTTAGTAQTTVACNGNCQVLFAGTVPAGSTVVGGVKHWYSKGQFYNSGDSTGCPNPSLQVGAALTAIPAGTCGAGEAPGTVNGKTVCASTGDGKQSDASKDKSTSDTTKTTVTNADGTKTTTETTVKVGADGSKETTVTKTTTGADGAVTGSSSVTTKDVGASSDESGSSECEKNSSAAGCGGSPSPDTGDYYVSKGKTMDTVLTSAKTAFMSSSIGTTVGNFFVVGTSSVCPTFSANIAYLKTTLTIDQFCSSFATKALAVFKVALLCVASFFAFRIGIE